MDTAEGKHFASAVFYLFFNSLVSKTPNADTKEDHSESKQHTGLRQDISQATAAQDEVQHALHGPARGEDFHSILN